MPDISEVKVKKPRKKYPKTTKKGTKDFTKEQKAEIIKRAEEVGINKAAEEFGSSWQAVAAMQREARAAGILPSKSPKSKGKLGNKPQAQKLAKSAQGEAEQVSKEPVASIGETAVIDTDEAVKSILKNNNTRKYTPLEIENAILREKVESLSQQVEKLRLAVSQLA